MNKNTDQYNKTQLDTYYRVGCRDVLSNNQEYKDEIPYKVPHTIVQA